MPADILLHIVILLFLLILLRVIIAAETSHKGLRKFLAEYRDEHGIGRLKRMLAIYLLRPGIKIRFVIKLLVVVYLTGLLLLVGYPSSLALADADLIPRILRLYFRVALGAIVAVQILLRLEDARNRR